MKVRLAALVHICWVDTEPLSMLLYLLNWQCFPDCITRHIDLKKSLVLKTHCWFNRFCSVCLWGTMWCLFCLRVLSGLDTVNWALRHFGWALRYTHINCGFLSGLDKETRYLRYRYMLLWVLVQVWCWGTYINCGFLSDLGIEALILTVYVLVRVGHWGIYVNLWVLVWVGHWSTCVNLWVLIRVGPDTEVHVLTVGSCLGWALKYMC
jgi:hypothetical protein